MKNWWKVFNVSIVVILILALVIVSFQNLSPYIGITIWMTTFVILAWCYAIFNIILNFHQKDYRPIYFSSSLFPIYKLDPNTNNVVEHNAPIMMWIMGLIILMFWGFLTIIAVRPTWLGVVITIVVEMIALQSVVFLRYLQNNALERAFKYIDADIAKSAWLDSKN